MCIRAMTCLAAFRINPGSNTMLERSILLSPAEWSFPVPIKYGPGRIADLAGLCRESGLKSPLLVTDRNSAALPFIKISVAALANAGLNPGLFFDVSPNPTDHNVTAGCAAFRAQNHDSIIAIGGGSGMDAGKAISLLAGNSRDLAEFDYDADPPELGDGVAFVPVICVPTTAGTGAETESTAMVTDTARGMKICVWHPQHKPLAVILDPELTVGLPANLTAWTGCDALIHAIEAYSVPSFDPMCDGLALEAIRFIYQWLPRAVEDGNCLEARAAMLTGSCMAGVSFLKGLGLVHAISHAIGAMFDTHHGLTNAILLAPVLRLNKPALAAKSNLMCEAMGLSGNDFETFYQAIVALLDDLGIPGDLTTLGVTEDRISEISEKAYGDAARATNPVSVTAGEIEAMLRQSMQSVR